ncbi:hydrophobin-domain-containing protein [Leucogyrophana mollusca]|uniref:Hydrophobin-domain-containing protein n=1 Tax=Leucogyrophana mollusca TaxID=85980 RepID=A0ACB8BJH6_9AGAM|nr:hydrophobin-domain-containing protein [Leucogyrophana mollusca]
MFIRLSALVSLVVLAAALPQGNIVRRDVGECVCQNGGLPSSPPQAPPSSSTLSSLPGLSTATGPPSLPSTNPSSSSPSSPSSSSPSNPSPSSKPAGTAPTNQCNTGSVQCCNKVQDASDARKDGVLDFLGAKGLGVTGLVGSHCSPITGLGTGSGASCSQQPVCCENNHYNGLVNIGCSPININA